MKGYIMLSEGRSGSNWIGSLAKNTGVLGDLGEWLGTEYLENDIADYSQDEFFEFVIKQGSTDNGRFAVKIFPRHLHHAHYHLGFDFIRKCIDEHETKLVLLTRRDRFAQAVSFARGIQSQQWTSRNEKQSAEHYDFDTICRAYFYISRSNQYWDAYLGVTGYDHDRFVYEDLLPDPTPILESLATALDTEKSFELKTDLKIQRDDISQEWLERFKEEVKTKGVLRNAGSFEPFGSFGIDKKTVRKPWLDRKISKLLR